MVLSGEGNPERGTVVARLVGDRCPHDEAIQVHEAERPHPHSGVEGRCGGS